MTQQELADRLNVHLQTVSKWERGVSEPDFALLGGIASALGASLEKLLGLPEEGELFAGSFDMAQEGRAIASARRAKGQSQEEVAAAAGVSPDMISKWERGVTCPDMVQLGALSRHFGVPASGLYFGIADDVATETPAQARRRRRNYLAAVLAAALLCAAAVVSAIVLPDALKQKYTVTVDGREYSVSSGDWFTPEKPEKAGYVFEYFVDDAGQAVDFPVKVTTSAEYYPVFAAREYTIDYWLNGGAFTAGAVYTFNMESGAVQLPVPQKSGAEFMGWYLSPDYSGEPAEQVECEASDIDVYARWSDEVYTVRYELNGGSLDACNPSSVTASEEYTLYEPLRGGYIFLGWYDRPSGGVRYESVGGAGAKNLTLYARWQQSGENFTVTYLTDGGELTGNNPVSVGAGEVHTLGGAVKPGYDFAGWNTAADGGGEWVKRLYGVTDNVTLYAIYSPKVYTVVYELNGGTYEGRANPNDITYGDSVALEPLVRGGHTFAGWFTAAEGGERIYEINASNIMRLTTVYARFTANKYTICLDGAGGTFALGGGTHEYFEYPMYFDQTLVLPECTLAGYDFEGWYSEYGERVYVIDAENIGNVTLTAKYREAGLTYNITYVTGGGSIVGYAPAKVAWGQQVTLPEAERGGWLFLGWNTARDGGGEFIAITPAEQRSDLTLYAVWQEIMVSGSARNFNYKIGPESAVVTGYTGQFGQNIDLVIPAYIDGKPVVAVEGRFDGYDDKYPEAFYLNSLEIPGTVKRLGENCFNHMCITQPVVIPASVEEIGAHCFSQTELSLGFEEGSALKSIGENAFSGSFIHNVPVLPEGLERLESNAFSGAVIYEGGIVLPDTLKYIGGYALAFECGVSTNEAEIYLPEGVEEIEPFAFGQGEYGNTFGRVYTLLTVEERGKFSDGWDCGAEIICVEACSDGITLKDGESERHLSGRHFALPVLSKDGHTFIGWRDESGNFVNFNYISVRGDECLEAVFEEQSPSDGRSEGAPLALEDGTECELIVFGDEPFWVTPGAETGERIRITFELESSSASGGIYPELWCDSSDGSSRLCSSGVSFTYRGERFRFEAGLGRRVFFRVKVRMDIV